MTKYRITNWWPDNARTLEPAHMTYWNRSGWVRDTDYALTWDEDNLSEVKTECERVHVKFPQAQIEAFEVLIEIRHRIVNRIGQMSPVFWTGKWWHSNPKRAMTFGEIKLGIEGTLAMEALAEVQKQYPIAVFESYDVNPTPEQRIHKDIAVSDKTFRAAVDKRIRVELDNMVSEHLQLMSTPRARMVAKVVLDCIADEYASQEIDQMNMVIRLIRQEF